jgi:hypothetical protein
VPPGAEYELESANNLRLLSPELLAISEKCRNLAFFWIAHCKSNRTATSAFAETVKQFFKRSPKMQVIFKRRIVSSGQLHDEGPKTSCESKPSHHSQSTSGSSSCCRDSCCTRCASSIEKSINNHVQLLAAGRDLAQKMHQLGLVDRLSCVPLTESGYRFLKNQFRIVDNYLSESDASHSGNRWGAAFHLRLIGARIRSARASSGRVARNCSEAHPFDSASCG